MRRSFKTVCTVALALVLTMSGLPIYSAKDASAATTFKSFPSSGQALQLETNKIEYMENNQYPSTASTNMCYMFNEEHGVGSFTVDTPSAIRAYYTWDTSNTGITISGRSWFSWDVDGRYILGNKWTLNAPSASSYVYVDPGTYYLNQQFTIKSGNVASSEYIGITVLIEPIRSSEKVYSSSQASPNAIAVNSEEYGFLSTTAPNDWYLFNIKEYGRVSISFYFYEKGGNTVKSGVCQLLNDKGQQFGTYKRTFNTNDYSQNVITAYLEPGSYYITMSGCTGPTYLKVGYTSYGITISGIPTGITTKDATIKVSTGIDASEVLIINRKVAESEKASNTAWTGSTNITDTMSYACSANGDYTVRVRDRSNNLYIKSFTVKGIDKQAPMIEGDDVENGQTVTADEKMIVITDDGEITKITLNGTKLDLDEYYDVGVKGYVLNLTEKRKHTIKAYDKAGNTTKFTFTLR